MSSESNPLQLAPLGQKILAHWRKYRPQMCQALEKEGGLRRLVYETQERVLEARVQLAKKNLDEQTVHELTQEMWQFPEENPSSDNPDEPQKNPGTTGISS